MSFPVQTPRPFTRTAIEALTPGRAGCYGLYREGTWVFVGYGDIRERLLAHLDGDRPDIVREGPTHFLVMITAQAIKEYRVLVARLRPRCNGVEVA